MAEIAGLAIGAVGLAGLFTTCVQCVDYISLGRNYGRDYEISMTKLMLLKARLSAWGESLSVTQKGSENAALRYRWLEVQDTVGKCLVGIKMMFEDGRQIKSRYGLEPLPASQDSLSITQEQRSNAFRQIEAVFRSKIKRQQEIVSTSKKTRWAIHDKKNFDAMIADLAFFIGGLENLSDRLQVSGLQQRLLQIKVRAITDADGVDLIEHASNQVQVLASSQRSGQKSTLANYTGQYANSLLRPVSSYVSRPRLHQEIKEQLHGQNNTETNDNARILAVCGLGGAGKSQLVLSYILENRRDYTGVFWIEAGSKETIERDYVQIYQLLYNRQTDTGQGIAKLEDAVPAVKRWFQGREGRWLVVLDSADTIDNERDKSYIDLRYFMPDAPGVYIIITSRSSTVKEMTPLAAVEVAEMEPAEATELFKLSAKMTRARPDEIKEVEMIVGELGHLALAIALAGSYVAVTPRLSSDIKGYLPEYQKRRKELLHRRPKQHIHRYRESVLSTWETSFEAIEEHRPAAARLLSLLAFLNFEDIFLGLIDQDGPNTIANTSAYTAKDSRAVELSDRAWRSFLSAGQPWSSYELESAFETLQSYCLIQWKSDRESYSIHKLVHAWGHDRLEVEEQRRLSVFALELMADVTAQEGVDPSYQVRLVPHAMASFGAYSRLYDPLAENAQDTLTMANQISSFLNRLGRWSEWCRVARFELSNTEIRWGKYHPDTLTSMNDLAIALQEQGSYEEAERIHRQTLKSMGRVLGKEHPNTLQSMNNLATVLQEQGSYEEAEQIHRQTLKSRERVLGKEHPDTLT
ncbi:MAG: hypothetical protein M1825_005966, partial [Sarcosagium campestre]